jgi:hypothetical protein
MEMGFPKPSPPIAFEWFKGDSDVRYRILGVTKRSRWETKSAKAPRIAGRELAQNGSELSPLSSDRLSSLTFPK